MSSKNAKVVIYYPDTNIILAEGEIDSEGKLNGEFNVYNRDTSKTVFKKMSFANGTLVSSQLVIGNKLRNINISDSSITSVTIRNSADLMMLLGIKVSNTDLSFDGTTSTIYGSDITVESTLSNSGGKTVPLLKVSAETKDGIILETNYKDVGTSEYIIDTKLINRTGIDLVQKVYKEGNILKPVYIKVKNIKEDEIHGTYKGSQVPSLGTIKDLN